MSEKFAFAPPRRIGMGFHLLAIALLIALAAAGVWQASRASLGVAFFAALLPFLLGPGPGPTAGLPGLRPLAGQLHPAARLGPIGLGAAPGAAPDAHRSCGCTALSDLGQSYPFPLLRWPGAVLGMRRLPGEKKIEYLASRSSQLVLIATQEQLYAISPEDPDGFLYVYQRFTELGSLARLPARSVYPSFLLQRVWSSRSARTILLASLGLSLALLAWVGMATSSPRARSPGVWTR